MPDTLTVARGKPLDLDVREKCRALYTAGIAVSEVARQTGVKLGTVATWAKRHKWTVARLNSTVDTVVEERNRRQGSLPQASERVRSAIARTLERQAEALALLPGGETANEIQKVLAAAEPLVRSAKIAFDWGSERGIAVVVVGDMDRLDRERAATVSAVQTVACGPDTPIGCGLPPDCNTPDTTIAK